MRRSKTQPGFSVVELLVACSVLATIAAVGVLSVQSVLKNQRVENACTMTVAQLRLARQKAIDERLIYLVRFQAPRTIQLYKVVSGSETAVGGPLTLVSDVEFRVEPGTPTNSTGTPDNFTTHNKAIDFDLDYADGESSDVRFQPDGSARDSKNRTNNGVIYMARPGELMSSRAVTLFGTTGRVKAWRPSKRSGTFRWE